jgi:2',5'-phosphodiesterase
MEIVLHKSDVICLQEVDKLVYEHLFYPALRVLGYAGYYKNKASNQTEGVCVFYKLDVFDDSDDSVAIIDGSIASLYGRLDDTLQHWIAQNPNLETILLSKVSSVYQIIKLVYNNKVVLISNTHLFYHPFADHIRLLQTVMLCNAINHTMKLYNTNYIVLTGDFNSDPLSGAAQMLRYRMLNQDVYDDVWKNLEWKWGDKDVKRTDKDCITTPPTIALPDDFPLLTIASGEPEFTNYTPLFISVLDYIYVSPNITTLSTAPYPTLKDIEESIGAMPAEGWSSDHVCLCVDLEFDD